MQKRFQAFCKSPSNNRLPSFSLAYVTSSGGASGGALRVAARSKRYFAPFSPGICTVFVQYMYSICTLLKRTYTVHILYKYCTYDYDGVANQVFMEVFFEGFLSKF